MPNRDMTGTGGPNPTGSTTGSSTTGSSQTGNLAAGSSTLGNSTSGGRSGVEDIKKTVSRAADDAMATGKETLGNAQGRIRSLLEQQTGRAADQLGGVANALHKAAEQLNECFKHRARRRNTGILGAVFTASFLQTQVVCNGPLNESECFP